MESTESSAPHPGASLPLEKIPLTELIGTIADRGKLLIEKEVQLAKSEIKADLKSELGMAKGLAMAAVALVLGLNLLLVSLVFVLAEYMSSWLAALVVGVPFLILGVIAWLVAWSKRVKKPLEVTRASVKESVEWAKNRLA